MFGRFLSPSIVCVAVAVVLAASASPLTGVNGGGFTSLQVLYAGDAPGLASGVTQINFQLPPAIEATGYPLLVQAGTAAARFRVNVID